ncbi:hypothetical protein [Flavobacterium sp. 9AF]|uniref:hypothetical protein n=1 Tax=Flavobacterium sp. 9AF TaxID=2653142 RepID=UPI00135C885D|nr:hypothetical protein [Flavobacterium sp. 9AF]
MMILIILCISSFCVLSYNTYRTYKFLINIDERNYDNFKVVKYDNHKKVHSWDIRDKKALRKLVNLIKEIDTPSKINNRDTFTHYLCKLYNNVSYESFYFEIYGDNNNYKLTINNQLTYINNDIVIFIENLPNNSETHLH